MLCSLLFTSLPTSSPGVCGGGGWRERERGEEREGFAVCPWMTWYLHSSD